MQAHQNDAFIKKLAAGNSYVPSNLDPEGSKEMGASFSQVFKKRNLKIQKKLDKVDRADQDQDEEADEETIEALIRGDNLNKQTEALESETDDSVVHDSEIEIEPATPTKTGMQAELSGI